MLQVWNMYLHEWLKFMVNVGKSSIHGAYMERNNQETGVVDIYSNNKRHRRLKLLRWCQKETMGNWWKTQVFDQPYLHIYHTEFAYSYTGFNKLENEIWTQKKSAVVITTPSFSQFPWIFSSQKIPQPCSRRWSTAHLSVGSEVLTGNVFGGVLNIREL